VATSTTEAEYMVETHATKGAPWLRKLMADISMGMETLVNKAVPEGKHKLCCFDMGLFVIDVSS
jgi:hypothetical protein